MKKCSLKEHKEIDAIFYCQECRIYICNKCKQFHSNWYKDHHKYNLDKDLTEIFTGFCQEKNHSCELRYFCKTHNNLCCAECITKIKDDENGQHTNCDVCHIEKIETEKKNKLNNNIKCLEDLSYTLEQSITTLKNIFEKIKENKEELILKVQKLFTKLRNIINNREDELLLEINNIFDKNFFNENLINKSEKLPNRIKASLEKGKLINEQWNNNKLNSLIFDCLKIEKNIDNIKEINNNIEKYNSIDINIKLESEEEQFNHLSEEINKFGKIIQSSLKLFDSKIEFDEELIKTWLDNKNFKTELLYRKTIDGSLPNDFHRKCDNKGITITIIETMKGNKFGGYTELQWDCSGKQKHDNSTFLFSFDKKKKYLSKKDYSSIWGNPTYGPWFGSNFPEIVFKSSLDKGKSWDDPKENIFFSGRILTNGEEFWDVKEIEVFKIIYT